jgi:DNA-directed RNA polymerase specialized sigma54-like protein
MIFLLKVGHFTMDNASNNKTFMEHLKVVKRSREGEGEGESESEMTFDAADRQIRCFAHVINLCSGRVLSADGAQNENNEHDSSSSDSDSDDNTATFTASSPIALARAVVRAIRATGTRRDAFDTLIKDGNKKGWFKRDGKTIQLEELQLLRDVKTRWDSVYHMLKRLHELRPVCHLLFEFY